MAPTPGYAHDRMIAALAALQPGIEPVILVLLTRATGLASGDYGWVAGAGQIGMAAGSIFCWGGGALATRSVALIAAGIAIAASLAVAEVSTLAQIAALRAIFGLCAGVIFTRSTGVAARNRPDHAFGTIFFVQLLLSTGTAALLPLFAAATSASAAIRLLALCPAAMLLLLAWNVEQPPHGQTRSVRSAEATPLSAAAVAALFLFVCATMMIWTYVGAIGGAIGLSDGAIGLEVAIGSLSGAVPAMIASYAKRRHAASAIALPCAAAMLTPLLALGANLGEGGFVTAMCLFNIGSTYALIRLSGLAIPPNTRSRSRRLVAALHCLGMAAGPMLAALSMGSGGFVALGLVATGALVLGIAALHAQHGEALAGASARRAG